MRTSPSWPELGLYSSRRIEEAGGRRWRHSVARFAPDPEQS